MRLVVAACVSLLVGSQALAKPLSCPTLAPATAAVPASEIGPLAATENAVDRAAMLSRVVATLRDRGVVASGIVDSLISAYCPLVAANASWSDQQKAARVRGFASAAVRAAYAFDSAEEIILDVAVAPAVANIVGERAAKDGVTPQEWAATAVVNATKAPQ